MHAGSYIETFASVSPIQSFDWLFLLYTIHCKGLIRKAFNFDFFFSGKSGGKNIFHGNKKFLYCKIALKRYVGKNILQM